MSRKVLSSALLAFVCAVLAACGAGGQQQQQQSQIQVSIQPQAVEVAVAGRAMLLPTVTGTSNTAVQLSVEETNGGRVKPSGEYVAPSAPGTYRVRAISVADPSKFAIAVVNVVAYRDRIANHTKEFPVGRSHQKTALLADESIIFLGGSTQAVQRYLPHDDRFESPNASLATRRYMHSATSLPDGRVLVAGGETSPTASASVISDVGELYEPLVGPFTILQNRMVHGRRSHTATALPDGNVLFIGGQINSHELAVGTETSELYGRQSRSFTSKASMPGVRYNHTATLLKDGRILVAGGQIDCAEIICERLNTALIYDPATDTFQPTGNLAQARSAHTATLLSDGRVLIVGGVKPGPTTFFAVELDSFEIYDPATGLFTIHPLRMPRTFHTVTTLNDGRVLIAGGANNFPESTNHTEILDPATMLTTEGPLLSTPRMLHSAHLLPSGKVMIVGGVGDTAEPLKSVDVFD